MQGEKDWQKYETARKLKLSVDSIRSEYQRAWTSREMKQRQRGVALYFIDKVDDFITEQIIILWERKDLFKGIKVHD